MCPICGRNLAECTLRKHFVITAMSIGGYLREKDCTLFETDDATISVIRSTFFRFSQTALFEFGSSLVVPWFILGSSLVFYTEEIGKVQRTEILRKVLF